MSTSTKDEYSWSSKTCPAPRSKDMRRTGRRTRVWSAQTVAAIARAIQFAHDHDISHLDLNPQRTHRSRRTAARDRFRHGVVPTLVGGGRRPRPDWRHSAVPFAEQASGHGDHIGPASDVFGLGGILFYLLTKTSLYSGENLFATLDQARNASYDPSLLDRPGIPTRLKAICLKALAKEPGDRFATAADLAQALERFLAPKKWLYAAMLACLFLLAVGLPWGIQRYRRGETPVVERSAKPALEVRIWRLETQFQPILKALPVRVGDHVQVHFRVPKGQAVTLCFVNTSGRLRALKQYPATDDDREITYPEVEQAKS